MKKLINAVTGICFSVISVTPVLANVQAAPSCPSLVSADILYINRSPSSDLWTAYFNHTPAPFDGGLVSTLQTNAQETEIVAKKAFVAPPSGAAKKISLDNGSWFWVCANYLSNYPTPQGVVHIFVASPIYSAGGNLSVRQYSILEKLQQASLQG